ncbi:hypothetical protein V8F20_000699 [Naviculisporaceae sp. PSN 640]
MVILPMSMVCFLFFSARSVHGFGRRDWKSLTVWLVLIPLFWGRIGGQLTSNSAISGRWAVGDAAATCLAQSQSRLFLHSSPLSDCEGLHIVSCPKHRVM